MDGIAVSLIAHNPTFPIDPNRGSIYKFAINESAILRCLFHRSEPSQRIIRAEIDRAVRAGKDETHGADPVFEPPIGARNPLWIVRAEPEPQDVSAA